MSFKFMIKNDLSTPRFYLSDRGGDLSLCWDDADGKSRTLLFIDSEGICQLCPLNTFGEDINLETDDRGYIVIER